MFMKWIDKFRIDKSIEIIGLDIAEMGGLSEELFDKIWKETVLSRANSLSMSPGGSGFRSSLG